MEYLRFTRNHAVFTIFIVLVILFFPIYFLFMLFIVESDVVGSATWSFIITMLFAIPSSIYAWYRSKSSDTAQFVRNLGPMVIKKGLLSGVNMISTPDFDILKIIHFKPMLNYKSSKNISLKTGLWRGLDKAGDGLTDKLIEIYKASYEGNISFEFFLSKEKIKIDVPEFNYFRSLLSTWNSFENWNSFYYEYPVLYDIIEKLPKWIKRTEIYSQDSDVSVSLFTNKEYCLNHSLEVYNELVNLKNILMQ